MTYYFVYEPDYSRIMMAVIIDNRASIPAIKNMAGMVIKSYVDEQIDLIDENCITYKIETELGVLAGFFAIRVSTVDKSAVLIMQVLRPAFQKDAQIPFLITNFIGTGKYKQDFLFSNS